MLWGEHEAPGSERRRSSDLYSYARLPNVLPAEPSHTLQSAREMQTLPSSWAFKVSGIFERGERPIGAHQI